MDALAVVDFGGQYTHLICRRFRDLGYYAEVVPSETPAAGLRGMKGIILSGGPDSVYSPSSPSLDPDVFGLGIPILGICYGMQWMAKQSGGKVARGPVREDGRTDIVISDPAALFAGLDRQQQVWMSHGDAVEDPGHGYRVLARTGYQMIAAIGNPERGLYGIQFHAEVDHTPYGKEMLRRFAAEVCGARQEWTDDRKVERACASIRETVGDGQVLAFISGGVDSAVAATLLARSLAPSQIHSVHVDNGLLRKGESALVERSLAAAGIPVRVTDYRDRFVSALAGIHDPQEKRRIIGDLFMTVADQEIAALGLDGDTFLLQGTLYTDLIESGFGVGRKADQIKLHHNASPLVQEKKRKGLVVEPNREMYKDEVRAVGEALGLPEELVWRHPFPGPGLAIRLVCSPQGVVEDLSAPAAAVRDIASSHGFTGYVMPAKTVGVGGDGRTYKSLALLAGMRDWDRLQTAAEHINREVQGVNRVMYLASGSPPIQEELWSPAPLTITHESLDLLRETDHAANAVLRRYGLDRAIGQMPFAHLPGPEGPWAVGRDVATDTYMTARPARKPEEMPWAAVDDLAGAIRAGGVDHFLLDLTNKPPGTIELE
ncbi:MAG: glutamine-hydrolyzing GMP synthase [Candidatus Aenigmarchaeota archaeon]|nr:glutamine-hydrolyzing GMP synthase [Candidatus Aenigmarchaeota archaeon]